MGAHFRAPATGVDVLDFFTLALHKVGGVGVNLFFALSGFLVGGLLLKELKNTGEVKPARFLIRRAMKIWPALYFLLLVHLLVGHHPPESFFWQNLFHVQNYFGTAIKQTWSLAVEEHFYLFLAFFIALHSGKTPKRLLVNLLIVAAISVVLRIVAVSNGWLDDAFRQTQYRMDSLLCGVMLAVLRMYYRETFDRIASYRVILSISLIGLTASIWLLADDPVLDRNVGYLVQGIGFSLLIIQVYTSNSGIKRSYLYRAIAWIGVYSYGIYLWHSAALQPGVKLANALASYGVDLSVVWLAAVTFQLIVGVVLGYLTTLAVEWPFLRLRERMFPDQRKPEPDVRKLPVQIN